MNVSDFGASGPTASNRDDEMGADEGAGVGESASAISGERSWRNLLELDAQLYKHKKIRMLTPEARVLINLKLNGAMPVTAAMQLAGVSYRGFYAVLERLKQAGLVGQARDKEDQRVRNLSIGPSTPLSPDEN